MFENLFWTFIIFSHIFNHFAENIMKTLSDDVKDDFVDLAETDELADSISKHAIVRVSWFESATLMQMYAEWDFQNLCLPEK